MRGAWLPSPLPEDAYFKRHCFAGLVLPIQEEAGVVGVLDIPQGAAPLGLDEVQVAASRPVIPDTFRWRKAVHC